MSVVHFDSLNSVSFQCVMVAEWLMYRFRDLGSNPGVTT